MNDIKNLELIVAGMTCEGCVAAVTRLIKRVDPAAKVAIDLASGKVDAATSSTSDAIIKAVGAGGYEARLK